MAGQIPLCFIIAYQISFVLCRNDYYQHYFSRHHRGSSTTEMTSTFSATDILESKSYDGDIVLQHSGAGTAAPAILIVALTVGGLFLTIGLIVLCCRSCRHPPPRVGYIVNKNAQQPMSQGQQQLLQAQNPQVSSVQLPPSYGTIPVQQQQQYYQASQWQHQQYPPMRQEQELPPVPPPPYDTEPMYQQNYQPSQWQHQQYSPIQQGVQYSTTNQPVVHPFPDLDNQNPAHGPTPAEKY